MQGTFQWAPGDQTPAFNSAYAKVGLDSSILWSYPPPTGNTATTITGLQLGSGTGGVVPGLLPKFSGTYIVADSCPATVIYTQPQPVNVCVGGTAIFYDSAVGAGLTYQWYSNCNTPIPGATLNFLVISPVTLADVGNYKVVVFSVCAPPYSSNCVPLSIGSAPYIVSQPLSETGCDSAFCDTMTFRVTGVANTIIWYHNGNIAPYGANQYRDSVVGPSQAYTDYSLVVCPVTLNDSGVYWATISNGCAVDSTIFVQLSVNPKPYPTVLAGGPTSFCGGAGVTLTSNTAPGYTFQWARNSVDINGATQASYTAASSGTYTVTITDANFCTNTSSGTVVNSTALPSPVIATAPLNANTTFCQGGSVTLGTPLVSGFFYQWQINSGSSYTNLTGPQATTDSFTATQAGSYQVVVTNSNNCVGTSNSIPVTVVSLPPNSITTQGTTTLCAGSQVNLVAPIGALYTYQWQQGGVNIVGATNFTYSANTAGQYTVVVSAGGCSSTSSPVGVTVTPLPQSTILTPATDPAIICADKNVTLNANTGSGYTYVWNLNGNAIPGQNSQSYTTSTAGNYTVTISDAGCSTTSAPFTVIVNPLPTPVISGVGNVLTCVGVYDYYQWFLNSVMINGANSQSFTAIQDGNYTVEVLDTLTGCYGFSPQPFNLTTLSTPVVTNSNANVRVYPNPATKLIYIDAPFAVNVTISAVDGKTVIEKSNVKSVDISELANGVYMLRVTNEDGAVMMVEKLVKTDF